VCFSAEADFAAGVVIGAVGIATLTKVRHRRELPLALLPCVFALHQIAQGFVWLSLDGRISRSAGHFALYVYVLYAWALLPAYLPVAVALVEPDARRRRWTLAFAGLGAVVAGYLLWAIVHESISAGVVGHTIRYRGVGGLSGLATVLYVVAACGSLLVSSLRRVRVFGVLNLAAVVVIVWVEQNALTSLWCTWAAIVSVLLYLEFSERAARADSKRADADRILPA
jgi:Family of unknown function (DUF6629)